MQNSKLVELSTQGKISQVTGVFVGQTYEYDAFSFLEHNREISKHTVRQLKNSMRKEGYCPSSFILVDEELNIYDGQHRFVSAKELGLPITFICVQDLNINHMKILNGISKTWSIEDFINYYAKNGKSDYILIKKLVEKSGISVTRFLNLLFDNRQAVEELLKLGFITLTEKQVERYNERLKMYKMLVEDYPQNFKIRMADDLKKLIPVLDNSFMCFAMLQKIQKSPMILFDLAPPASEMNHYEVIAKQVMSEN